MTHFLELLIVCAAAGLILTAAWQDFTNWKIPNWTVLALIALYGALALLRAARISEPGVLGELDSSPFLGDVAAGLLLFFLGFVLWALRMLGAGDAKLFLPIGLFVGMSHLFMFGIGLAASAVAVAIALRIPIPIHYQTWPVMRRIEQIRTTGKVPYGIVMAAAALLAMFLRYGRG